MKKLIEELARKISEHEAKKSSGPKVEIEVEAEKKPECCPKCGQELPAKGMAEDEGEEESVVG